MRWIQTLDVVWFALEMSGFVALKPVVALMRSAGEREIMTVRVEKMQ